MFQMSKLTAGKFVLSGIHEVGLRLDTELMSTAADTDTRRARCQLGVVGARTC